ncbi:hypothetical protein Q8F55_000021 [Vanrija albida]|uniref:Uncharacterized protein n=1 Tax=Vanrija albida TaxID=181172 RepID=A0ABR3QCN6_9TREE
MTSAYPHLVLRRRLVGDDDEVEYSFSTPADADTLLPLSTASADVLDITGDRLPHSLNLAVGTLRRSGDACTLPPPVAAETTVDFLTLGPGARTAAVDIPPTGSRYVLHIRPVGPSRFTTQLRFLNAETTVRDCVLVFHFDEPTLLGRQSHPLGPRIRPIIDSTLLKLARLFGKTGSVTLVGVEANPHERLMPRPDFDRFVASYAKTAKADVDMRYLSMEEWRTGLETRVDIEGFWPGIDSGSSTPNALLAPPAHCILRADFSGPSTKVNLYPLVEPDGVATAQPLQFLPDQVEVVDIWRELPNIPKSKLEAFTSLRVLRRRDSSAWYPAPQPFQHVHTIIDFAEVYLGRTKPPLLWLTPNVRRYVLTLAAPDGKIAPTLTPALSEAIFAPLADTPTLREVVVVLSPWRRKLKASLRANTAFRGVVGAIAGHLGEWLSGGGPSEVEGSGKGRSLTVVGVAAADWKDGDAEDQYGEYYPTQLWRVLRESWAKAGLSDDEADAAAKVTRFISQPAWIEEIGERVKLEVL